MIFDIKHCHQYLLWSQLSLFFPITDRLRGFSVKQRLYLQWLLDIYISGLSHLAHIDMNWNTIKVKTKEPVMHLEVTTIRLSWYCTTSWWCVVVKCPFVFFSVTPHEIKVMTAKDSVLSNVLRFVPNGWPITAVTEELKPYYRRRENLVILKDVYCGVIKLWSPHKLKKQSWRFIMWVGCLEWNN